MQTLLLSTPNVRQANRINYLLKDETLESHLNTVNQTKANTRHYTYKIFAAHAIVGADEKISTRAVNHVHVWMNCTQTRSETQWNERTSEYIYNVTPRLWRYCLINRIIKLNKKEEKNRFSYIHLFSGNIRKSEAGAVAAAIIYCFPIEPHRDWCEISLSLADVNFSLLCNWFEFMIHILG